MNETGVQIVLCTFPDADTARQIGTAMVERQLARCVNLIPSVESIYEWEGNIERGNEVLAIFKVSVQGYQELERELNELHPYEVPEILAIEVKRGLAAYLSWVGT